MARYNAKIDVIDRDLTVTMPELGREAQNRLFQDYAARERDWARAQNRAALGYAPDYEQRIDGAPGPLTRASVDSVVEIEFQLVNTMFEWIADMLILNSPFGREDDPRPGHPGLYGKSHVLFIDGQMVEPDQPLRMPQDEAFFINLQPYARKVERGLSNQSPDGTYHTVAVLAQRRYGNVARIRFTYRTPYRIGAIHDWASRTAMPSPGHHGPRREEWLNRQPAIVIQPY